MAFNKVGTPQKMTIVSGKCSICGTNPGQNSINGVLVCNQCASKKTKEEEVEDAN